MVLEGCKVLGNSQLRAKAASEGEPKPTGTHVEQAPHAGKAEALTEISHLNPSWTWPNCYICGRNDRIRMATDSDFGDFYCERCDCQF